MARVTKRVSGSIATFNSPGIVPIRSCKVHFSPVQEGSGDPSPENVMEISGWTGVRTRHLIDKSGINRCYELIPISTEPIVNGDVTLVYLGGGTYQFVGTNDTSSNLHFVVEIEPLTNLDYGNIYENFICLNAIGTTTDHIQFALRRAAGTNMIDAYFYRDENGEYVSSCVLTNGPVVYARFTLLPGQGNFTLHPIIHFSNENFEEYTSFGQELCGGYVDLITGQLVADRRCVNLEDLTWSTGSNRADSYGYGDQAIPTSAAIVADLIAEQAYAVSQNTDLTTYPDGICIMQNGGFRKYFDGENYPQGKMVYKLATPITYQLDPVTLQTLRGVNNIWSNANGDVEVKYDYAESPDILTAKRRFAYNSPHIESVSGSAIASFRTDMASPLKSCVVNFLPVQSGSGDPSPSNIRPVSGWTGVSVYRAGANLLDSDALIYGEHVNSSGEFITNSSFHRTDYILIPPGNYTYSADHTVSVRAFARVCGYDKDKNFVAMLAEQAQESTNPWDMPFAVPNGVSYIVLQGYNGSANEMLNVGSTKQSYEAYTGNLIETDWTDSAGTIYGGYVDIVKGTLVQTWKGLKVSDFEWTYQSAYKRYRAPAEDIKLYDSRITPFYSSVFQSYSTGGAIADAPNDSIYGAAGLSNVYVRCTEYSSVSAFTAAYGDEIIVYPLETPIEYAIDPETIKAVKGSNSVWSSAGESVEVKYWKH